MDRARLVVLLALAAGVLVAVVWWLLPTEPADLFSSTLEPPAAPAAAAPTPARAPEPEAPPPRPEPTPEPPPQPEPPTPSANVEPPGSAAPVAGVVRSSRDQRALEGVQVEAALLHPRPRAPAGPTVWSAVTDAEGAFRSPPLPADRPLTLRFRAPGYVSRILNLGSGSERKGIEIPLPPGGVIEGTVRDPDGRPIEGASVTIPLEGRIPFRSQRLSGGGSLQEHGPEGVSGPEGRFRIEGVPLDETRNARASHERFLRSEPVETRAGAGPVELRLRRGGGLEIRVLGPQGPVPEAEVRISWLGGRHPGGFVPGRSFPVLEPGSYRVQVWAKGFRDRSLPVEVLEGRNTVSEVHVEPAMMLAGIVLDEGSVPVSGAWVRARGSPDALFGRASTGDAFSDETGRFRIAGLQPGTHEVTCEAEGLDEVKLPGIEPPDQRLVIRLARHARMRGQIVVPPGVAAPAGVTIMHPLRGSKSDHVREVRLSDGRFELDGVPAGKVRLRFLVAGLPLVTREVEVPPGTVADLGALVFGPGLPLHGQVVDPAGAPVAGATVIDADPNAMFFDSIVTGDDGRFRLESLPDGEIELRIEAENFLPTRQTAKVERGASPLTVQLRRGGLLKGEIVFQDGEAAPSKIVTIKGPDAPPRSLPSDKEGRFEARLPAGTHRVGLRDQILFPEGMQSRGPIEIEVELREGEETPVTLRLPGRRPR